MSHSSAPSEKFLNPNSSTTGERGSTLGSPTASRINEQNINDKILAKNINILKDFRNYYETETNNYKKKLSRLKILIT